MVNGIDRVKKTVPGFGAGGGRILRASYTGYNCIGLDIHCQASAASQATHRTHRKAFEGPGIVSILVPEMGLISKKGDRKLLEGPSCGVVQRCRDL